MVGLLADCIYIRCAQLVAGWTGSSSSLTALVPWPKLLRLCFFIAAQTAQVAHPELFKWARQLRKFRHQ